MKKITSIVIMTFCIMIAFILFILNIIALTQYADLGLVTFNIVFKAISEPLVYVALAMIFYAVGKNTESVEDYYFMLKNQNTKSNKETEIIKKEMNQLKKELLELKKDAGVKD